MGAVATEVALGPLLARGLGGKAAPLHPLCLAAPPSVPVVVLHHSPPPVQGVRPEDSLQPVGSGRQGSHAVEDAQDHRVAPVIVPLEKKGAQLEVVG